MKKLNKLLFLSLFFGTVLYSLPSHANTPKAVSHVDIKLYAGEWHEIARLPMFFKINVPKMLKPTINYRPMAL